MFDLAGLSNDASAEIDPELTRQINLNGGCTIGENRKGDGRQALCLFELCVRIWTWHQDESHRIRRVQASDPVCTEQDRGGKELKALEGPSFEPVIFRNATIFGLAPRMRFDLAVNIMTLRAWKERVIYVMGGGEQWRPFIHVNDVVHVLVRGLEADSELVAGQIFNVGDDGMNYQIRQLAQFVLDVIPT